MFLLFFGLFAGVFLLFLHYFPYPRKSNTAMYQLGSYVVGVAAISAAEVGVWFFSPESFPWALIVVPGIVGACVLAAWAFDHIVEQFMKKGDDLDAAIWSTDEITG